VAPSSITPVLPYSCSFQTSKMREFHLQQLVKQKKSKEFEFDILLWPADQHLAALASRQATFAFGNVVSYCSFTRFCHNYWNNLNRIKFFVDFCDSVQHNQQFQNLLRIFNGSATLDQKRISANLNSNPNSKAQQCFWSVWMFSAIMFHNDVSFRASVRNPV